jgi:hypothetical protein
MTRWLSTMTVFVVPHHSLYNFGRMHEVWLDR